MITHLIVQKQDSRHRANWFSSGENTNYVLCMRHTPGYCAIVKWVHIQPWKTAIITNNDRKSPSLVTCSCWLNRFKQSCFLKQQTHSCIFCDRGVLNTQTPRFIFGWWLDSRLGLGWILHFCSIYPYTVSRFNGKLWPFVTFHNPSLGFTKMIQSAPVSRSVCYGNSLAMTSVFCKGPLLHFNHDIFHCTQW